jgi:flagellar biosynthesis chaperone FliJ
MKAFKFRLENYLKIKEFEEKNSWNEVLKQEARVALVKKKIEEMWTTMQRSREEKNLLGSDPKVNQAKVELINDSLIGLEARMVSYRREYQVEMKLLEKMMEVHAEKRKDAKIIDKFKGRKKQEFKVGRDKAEQKQINEIAGHLFNRREKKYG